MAIRSPLAASRGGHGRPRYVSNDGHGQWCAVFPSGKHVTIDPGRVRNYPGFNGDSPPTAALYAAVAGAVDATTVIDAGAGCGEGAALLQRHHARVLAVDCDEQAVGYGRLFAPNVAWSQADLANLSGVASADLVCVVDVLTHLREPGPALCALRSRVAARGRLFVAEARAVPSQQLRAPQRRGYCRTELVAALTRAGFRIERSVPVGSEFISLLAEPDETPASSTLVEAVARMKEVGAGEDSQLREQLEICQRTGRAGIVVEASLMLAELACKAGDHDLAMGQLERLVERRPRDGRVWSALSNVARQRGGVEQAWHFAVQATDVDPGCYVANLSLALSAQLARRPDAVEAWGYVARLCPAEVAPVARLARVAAERGDYKTGIVAFERLLSYANEPNLEVNTTLGWLLLMDGQLGSAMHHATRTLFRDPHCDGAAELLTALSGCCPQLVPDA